MGLFSRVRSHWISAAIGFAPAAAVSIPLLFAQEAPITGSQVLGRPPMVNETNQEKLYFASFHGNVEEVRDMLRRKAQPNIPRNGSYPLIAASVAGHADVVKVLIGANADVNIEDSSGKSPLIQSLRHPGIMRILLRHGALVNHITHDGRDHFTPLARAVADRLPEAINLLLEYGADPSIPVTIGFRQTTAVDLAREQRDNELASRLQSAIAGTEPSKPEGPSKRSPASH